MQMEEQGALAVPVLSVFICRRLFLRTGTAQFKLRHTTAQELGPSRGRSCVNQVKTNLGDCATSYMTPGTAGDNIPSTNLPHVYN